MKKINVIGIGLGGASMTEEARKTAELADVLFGAPRMLEAFSGSNQRKYPFYLAKDIAEIIAKEDAGNFAVLVSGDVGFYSAASAIVAELVEYDVSFIPGISTVNAFFARLKKPWQDAQFISAHGRCADIVSSVRRSRLSFCITGGNIGELGASLTKAGLGGVKAYIGENIGGEDEKLFETTAAKLSEMDFPPLTVLLFENEDFDASIPTGIPDKRFKRLDGVPMTKSEIRAAIMSKLCIKPGDICWDVGAGTGSVTVEMALSAYGGRVFAVERKGEAAALIEENCAFFHIGNVDTVVGSAPAALEPLPAPDAVFIGGSGGEIERIITLALGKNPGVRIVVAAITLETVSAALSAFKNVGAKPQIVQITAARAKLLAGLNLMEGLNPVTILSIGENE